MMGLFSQPGGAWRRLPRYVALAPLLHGRRVLALDCQTPQGAAYLAAGRCRDLTAVVGAEHDVTTIQDQLGRPGLRFCADAGDSLPFEDGAFDAVICFSGNPCSSPRLAEARRVLKADGVALIALDNPTRSSLPIAGEQPEAPGDHSGHGLALGLRRTFREVHLLGQLPSLGFLFADLENIRLQPPRMSSDLVGGTLEEVDAWVAVCWDDYANGELEATTLVQMSFSGLCDALLQTSGEIDERISEMSASFPQAVEFQQRLQELEVALQEAEEPGQTDQVDPETNTEIRRLKALLNKRDDQLSAKEGESRSANARIQELSRLLVQLEDTVREAAEAHAAAHADRHALRREHGRLLAEIQARDQHVEALEQRIVQGGQQLLGDASMIPAEKAWRQAAERADALAEALRNREEHITALEADLMTIRQERYGKDD